MQNITIRLSLALLKQSQDDAAAQVGQHVRGSPIPTHQGRPNSGPMLYRYTVPDDSVDQHQHWRKYVEDIKWDE